MKKLLILLFVVVSNWGFAQSDSLVLITTNFNDKVVGKIIKNTYNDIILVGIKKDTISLPKFFIDDIRDISSKELKKGDYWKPNPIPSDYFISKSAFNLKKGESIYNNTLLSFNSVTYGLTDNISLNGGIFLPLPFFNVGAKGSFRLMKNIRLGGGITYINNIVQLNTFKGMGLSYVNTTIGNEDNNLTVNYGYGFYGGKLGSNPLIILSGTTRISKKISLITENWLIPHNGNYRKNIYSGGIRLINRNTSWNFGLGYNDNKYSKVIPYVSFNYML